MAIALCHNVSPVGEAVMNSAEPFTPAAATADVEDGIGQGSSDGSPRLGQGGSSTGSGDSTSGARDSRSDGGGGHEIAAAGNFQGASPDELALVQFAARCGLVRIPRLAMPLQALGWLAALLALPGLASSGRDVAGLRCSSAARRIG